MAFRGHKTTAETANKGNFLDLVLLLAIPNPVLAGHLEEVRAKGKSITSFVTWERQNQLIECLAQYILDVICNEIRDASVWSVSMDSTFDASKKEQLVIVIRYTKDGAGNMRGDELGVKTRILAEAPSAVYSCAFHAHRFNLVVSTVTCCADAVDLFGNLETIYNDISNAKTRVDCYRELQAKLYPDQRPLMMQRVRTTRWSSYDNSLSTAVSTHAAVVGTLEKTIESEKKNSNKDYKLISKFQGIIKYLISNRILTSAFIFRKIFSILGPVTKILQARDLDFLVADGVLTKTNMTCRSSGLTSAFVLSWTQQQSLQAKAASTLSRSHLPCV
ncbi:hypothetical protein ONE63_006692 [Megalurothrips usitatus]|uniref:DUF4371 domain-containing protein n=1 Tax=Megalurothrips usitatus TaxID=439358 RepID=A0AAV7XUT8_9NEOP|nr:hypothetical protein ONE63_006692 [Megalurothrips usitatus]